MVVENDFEFQLVSAEDDDKTPFKEHRKGLNTYVEVEPDAEYFLSIRKVRASSSHLYCEYHVDGKNLGYYEPCASDQIETSPKVRGIYSRANGVETQKALKFVTASFTSGDPGIGSTRAGMGQIKMEVYRAIHNGHISVQDHASSFTTSSIKSVSAAPVTMKKNLRSGEGNRVKTTACSSSGVCHSFLKGAHLYTITLHYCATPGLIAVGVLPKPPLWDYHRMLKPATTTTKEKEKLEKFSVKRNASGKEILELEDSDSDTDDDDDDDDDKKNDLVDHSLPQHQQKKAKRESSKEQIYI